MKELVKIELNLNSIPPEKAQTLQYELSKNLATYRVFINPYTKSAVIVFDEKKLSKEELLKLFEPYGANMIGMERLTLEELIGNSMSWKNVNP